jgi:transglutaminase-like putative cysteine protease
MTDKPEIAQRFSSSFRFDWIAVVLAILIVFCASASVAMAEWVPSLDVLSLTVVVSGSVGALIATSRWRPRTAHVIMLLYGLAWVTLLSISDMPDKVYGFTWLDSVRQLVIRLGEHIYIWFEAISSGGVGKDNAIFLLVLSAGFWLIAYLTVWNTIRRQRLWLAVAPAGIILLVNMYYYGGQEVLAFWLIVYLFAVLLYAARLYTLWQEVRWQFGRIRFKPEIERDFLQIGAMIALAAVLFGTVVPTFAGAPQISGLWREISRPVRSVEDTFSRLFSGLQPHGLPYNNPFGRTLALLGQRNLGTELVMEVRSPESRYWQGVIYDRYTGGAFQSSDAEQVAVTANEQIAPTQFRQRSLLTQTVTVFFPNNTLIFAAPQPVAINQTGWLDQLPGGEFSMWTTLSPLGPGDTYRVISAVSRATIEQLRSAGSNYPPAIRERYLQLPDTLPGRVPELARQIVTDAKAATPYDQAVALETWLRVNITYNDQIASPAPGQDGVDYVLFVTKQGFCDYYASAMAVMARSLGLPSRVATGFAPGTFDSKRGVYQVYQNNAHTWVEVYFPNYGWIQFEPTASQPSLERLSDSDVANDPNSPDKAREDPTHRGGRQPEDEEFDPFNGPASELNLPENTTASAAQLPLVLVVSGAIAGLILLVAGGGWAGIWWYENRRAPRQTGGGTWAFARLTRLGSWLRVKLSTAHTPFEQAQLIGQVVPKRQSEIDHLADLYVRERYGRAAVDVQETRSIWQRIHWSLWRAGFKRRASRRLPKLRRRAVFRRHRPE